MNGRQFGWEVVLWRYELRLGMLVVLDRPDGTYIADSIDPQTRSLKMVPYKEATPAQPLLWIDRDMEKPLLRAIQEALTQEGVKPDSDVKLAGVLEAQRYHLEDMRKLLKLPSPQREKAK